MWWPYYQKALFRDSGVRECDGYACGAVAYEQDMKWVVYSCSSDCVYVYLVHMRARVCLSACV